MNKNLLACGSVALMAVLLCWACRKARLDEASGGGRMTLQEARDVFGYQFLETRSEAAGLGRMMPGDFTPLWDEGNVYGRTTLDGADIPIVPTYLYTARYERSGKEGEAGDTHRANRAEAGGQKVARHARISGPQLYRHADSHS